MLGKTFKFRDITRKMLLEKQGIEPIEIIPDYTFKRENTYRVSFREQKCFLFTASFMTDDAMEMEKARYDYLIKDLANEKDACRLIQNLYDYQQIDASDCGCPAVEAQTTSRCAALGVPLNIK